MAQRIFRPRLILNSELCAGGNWRMIMPIHLPIGNWTVEADLSYCCPDGMCIGLIIGDCVLNYEVANSSRSWTFGSISMKDIIVREDRTPLQQLAEDAWEEDEEIDLRPRKSIDLSICSLGDSIACVKQVSVSLIRSPGDKL